MSLSPSLTTVMCLLDTLVLGTDIHVLAGLGYSLPAEVRSVLRTSLEALRDHSEQKVVTTIISRLLTSYAYIIPMSGVLILCPYIETQ